jgi:hypothetical protein
MSKIYDKLLFTFAIFAFAAGFGFALNAYVKEQKAPPKAKTQQIDTVAVTEQHPYQDVTLPNPVQSGEPWKELAKNEQLDDLWDDDLFTPAGVQWSKSEGAYQPTGTEPEPEDPFGVHLLSISRPVYRLILKSEIPVKSADGKLVLAAQIYDNEGLVKDPQSGAFRRGVVSYNVRNGQVIKNDGLNVIIIEYKSETVKSPTGVTQKVRTLRLRDNDRKREITLLFNKPYEFEELTDIELARDDTPTEKWRWRAAGDTKSLGDLGDFTLKSIDFQNKTVTVEKKYQKATRKSKKKIIKTQTETLQLPVEKPIAPKTKPVSGVNASIQ